MMMTASFFSGTAGEMSERFEIDLFAYVFESNPS
jgi:hypothetical protein